MKKYIAIIGAMMFVLGFAASAFAIHAEIPAETSAIVVKGESMLTLSGELRFRGEIRETDFDNDTGSISNYDGRVRLGVDVKVAPNATGFLQLEAGDSNTNDVWVWGNHGDASTGSYPWGNAKTGDLRIIQAWINYKPTDMIGIKVGHMPLALGNKIFFNHTKFGDDAIVVYADPNKNLHVAALTIKFDENGNGSDDQDAYVGLAVYKGGTFNVGGDVTYIVANSGSDLGAAVGGESTIYNIGVNGDVAAGPVTIMADIEYQGGNFGGSDGADVDHKGTAYWAGVSAKLGPVDVMVDAGMGSGDEDASDPTKTLDDDNDAFATALGAHLNAPLNTYVYDYRVPSACVNTLDAAGITGGPDTQNGICNTTFVAGRASGKAAKNISWKAQVVWLKATEDVSIRGGDADDSLGIEFDGSVSVQLAKGLKYWIEGGYLSAGDAYKDANDDADNVWAVRNGLALNF